jgi:hypothetical protein
MSKENLENEQLETPVPLDPSVQELQLSDDDLDAVIGGLRINCDDYTSCKGYSS